MAAQSRRRPVLDIWPGFVDALANLLIIVIFTLMIFVLAQFYLTDALSGRDRALERLQREIERIGEMLALERSESDTLRKSLSEISAELQATLGSRDELREEMRGLESEIGGLRSTVGAMEADAKALREEIARLAEEAEALRVARQELLRRAEEIERERDRIAGRAASLEGERDKLTEEMAQLTEERDRLAREVLALRAARERLEAEAGDLRGEQEKLAGVAAALEEERDRLAKEVLALRAARDRLAEQAEAVAEERDRLRGRLGAVSEEAGRKTGELAEARAALELLNRQVAALREQLASLQEALDAEEAQNKEQRVEIEELTRRLNVALASKVRKLEQYRSEFFGRLREVLGSRSDIQIVGDRFVFQSEVLFDTASTDLGANGRTELDKLADALKDIAGKIPDDIDWVLRVDGHTDRRPIQTPDYPSNWELSTARAVSVVKYLIAEGIPPRRLAATGFGEYRPIAQGESDAAHRRNRRIELKFDQR